MSEQEQNIEVVKRGYDAFSSGDLETMMSLFDDNIEWVQPGDSVVSGTYHGKGELGEYFRKLGEKTTTIKALRFIADGDTVVVLSDVTVGTEAGQGAEVFTLRDGKTVRAQLFEDTALMERVYGKKQTAAAG
ncbi:nuclear transport factor 2 family protein [Mycobacterium sp. ML4]|jgi:ketosteroid isomerase-like protein